MAEASTATPAAAGTPPPDRWPAGEHAPRSPAAPPSASPAPAGPPTRPASRAPSGPVAWVWPTASATPPAPWQRPRLPAHRKGPLRWRAAGWLEAALPDRPGRGRVVGWVRGPRDGYDGPLRGRLRNGMEFDLDNCRDESARALSALRYRPPALAAVFDAVLRPGDTCYDVGANLGVYTLWAAGLVGPTGQVHAFEPVPATMAVLASQVLGNGLEQVVLVPAALGATAGTTGMRVYAAASDRAHAVADPAWADHVAPMETLDGYAARHRPPDLVKIDVGHGEIDVLRGGAELLASRSPALLLEMLPGQQAWRGGGQAELVGRLIDAGYLIFNLTPRGLAASGPFTRNVLALAPRWERFGRVVAALERTPFPRDQRT